MYAFSNGNAFVWTGTEWNSNVQNRSEGVGEPCLQLILRRLKYPWEITNKGYAIFFWWKGGGGWGGWKQGVLREMGKCSQRKQPTFGDATSGFPAKWRLRNERNSILMTRNYPDLDSASDWLNQISHATRPIRGTTQIWVVTRHRYGISALVSQTSFGGETSVSVAKYRLFSQARANDKWSVFTWRHHVHYIGVPKQGNGGYVGFPNQSCASSTLFVCKNFLLLQ